MKRAAVVAFALLTALSLRAQQQFPTLERGLQPGKLYHFAGIDNVNVFNGNLTIAFPIGMSYPLNGGLSYQLSLSYNSNLWDWESSAGCAGTGTMRWAVPALRSNAGDGWLLGFGDYIPHGYPDNKSFADVFIAPDGGEHRFDKTDANNANVKYTNDGSNLRLRTISATSNIAFIDFPDGTIQKYIKNTKTTKYELREIDAPRGNASVLIDPLSDRPAQCDATASSYWTVTDGKRTHYLCYQKENEDYVDRNFIQKIVLDGPQNQQTVYRFAYNTFDVVPPYGEPAPFQQPCGFGNTFHRVTVLKSITLPDGSQFKFEHDPDTMQPIMGLYGGPELNAMVLPTGARHEYTYSFRYGVPPMQLCLFGYDYNATEEVAFGTPPTVITARTVRPANVVGGTPQPAQTWNYGYTVHAGQKDARCTTPGGYVPIPTLFEELVTSVSEPDGTRTDAHFSVWPGDMYDDSVDGYKGLYYGFPYGAYDASQNRWLSTERFQCANGNCKKVRTTYVRHDLELRPKPEPSMPEVPMPWHRLASQKVFFNDDPSGCTTDCRSITSEMTDWDTIGHYRTVTTTNDFGGVTAQRVETTDWNKPGGVQRVIGANDPWTVDEYDNKTLAEAGVTFAEQACYAFVPGNPNQRFLAAKRVMSGASPAANDVITTLSLDGSGNLEYERYFGGDKPGLTGGAATAPRLCDAINGIGGPAYEIHHHWTNGVIDQSQYTGASFLSLDLTVDKSGVINSSRDSAGVQTKYFYDPSGRVTRLEPAGVPAIIYDYPIALLGSSNSLLRPAMATEKRESGDPAERDFYFDSLGRVWREKNQMPNGKFRLRENVFDVFGHHLSSSEWADLPTTENPLTMNLPYGTSYFNYDTFGRVGLVTAADGSSTSFQYTGDSKKVKTTALATTTEEYDGFGRMIKVTEPAGANGADTVTEYGYDPVGRLTTVKMKDTTSGVHQDRSFQYDGRGYLKTETHPETDDTTYGAYDPRGHALSRTNGGKTLSFEYDAAEHLHKVKDDAGNVIKQFEYGTGSTTGDNGKLVSAVRRNDLQSAGRVDVTETYEYGETAAQLSKRTTLVESVAADATRTPMQRFELGLSGYDQLLLPTTVTMPTCFLGDCTKSTTEKAIETVSVSRNSGFLTSVDGFGAVDYQPSGMVAKVTHATAEQPADVYDARFGLPRPSKITFAGCSNPTPYFLPGQVIAKANPAACGIQVSWPPAVWCGFSTDIKYRVLRDGADVSGCLSGVTSYVDTTAAKGVSHSYSVVAEGPKSGGDGLCQSGQTVKLNGLAPASINSCSTDASLTTNDVTLPIGTNWTFKATLLGTNGPVPDEPLLFTILGKQFTARTGTDGVARVDYVVDTDPGVYNDHAIVVSYAGTLYSPQTAVATLEAQCSFGSFTVKPGSLNVKSPGGPFGVFVGVSTHCGWTPVPDAVWKPDAGAAPLSVDPNATQKGTGTFTINVPSSTAGSRSSSVLAGFHRVNVQQSGDCTYTFNPGLAYFPGDTRFQAGDPNSGMSSMDIAAPSDCSWTVSVNVPWIYLVPATAHGTGPGTVRFQVDVNNGDARTAKISIDGTTASANINQAKLPPVQCPDLKLDLYGDEVITKNWQNLTLRAYAEGTRVVYDWYINDRPCQSCPHNGSLTILPGDEGYPPPGQTYSYQVGFHVDNSIINSCGVSTTKVVSVTNNVQPGACSVPVLYDSLFRPNGWPGDGLSPFPFAPVQMYVVPISNDPNDKFHFHWYKGTAGDRSSPFGTDSDTANDAPPQTTYYWVEVVSEACGAQQSRTSVVVVTPQPGRIRPCCHFSMTGSGHDDLVWHNAATGANEVWAMTGNAVHSATIQLPNSAPTAQLQSLGDLNGDEKVDLLWHDPSTGANSAWIMNYTNFNYAVPLEKQTDLNWTIGAVGDITGEGKDSVVWHNEATGENQIWFQDGTDHAGTWALPSNATSNWGLHGIGDFNGDGKGDLFFHDAATGQNQIWMIDDAKVLNVTSNSTASAQSVLKHNFKARVQSIDSMPDTNWVPAAIADLNGDGKPDIMWRNKVTGENTVWIMDGVQHADSKPLETRSDPNWVVGGGGSTTTGKTGTGGGGGSSTTTLHVTADPAPLGTATAVTATLTAGTTPVANRVLVFSLNGAEKARLATDGSGSATAALTVAGLAAGAYPNAVSVRFEGDATYTGSTGSADLVINGALPVVTWSTPSAIVYGTPLSGGQLNASANVPGNFVYSPPAGAVLTVGYQTLSVTFTPSDATMSPVTTNVVMLVNKASSSVAWTAPASIVYGTPLSAAQLNATSPLTGTFSYAPAAGAVLPVGTGQTLSVTFTPDDPNYNPSSTTTTIGVDKGQQILRWDPPAPIDVLQALTNVQLNATVIPSGTAPAGALTYDPPAGSLLTAGPHELRVTAAATDSYEAASTSVDIVVTRVAPALQWATPANIVYGTPLGAAQLNATASIPGAFTYSPAAGTILDAGAQQLSVVFTPTDSRYDPVSATVTLQVDKGQQTLTWSKPASVVYGTALSPAQLNARVSVSGPDDPGRLVYTPDFLTVLGAGTQTLTVSALETRNYASATMSVTLDVSKATPVLTWAAPAPIVYGTPLTSTQLSATASVAGTFVYTPPAGTILDAGAGQTLQTVFTPSDAANYNGAAASVQLTVNKANQTITWATPADIVYGTALSSAQLNATVAVVGPAPAGALAYTPPAGTLLQAGPGQTLSVTAAATADYNAATATVLLTVQKAKPVITWAAPAGIVYGTALSSTQLNATANVPGTFVYTPPAGTILNAGAAQTLSVAFTPDDAHNYDGAAATTTIDVAKAKQTLAWTAPAPIVYGTRLGAAQLNATVTVVGPATAGQPVYAPPAGTALDAGAGQTLTVTAQGTPNYEPATTSVSIDVKRAPLTLKVDDKSKVYGAALPTLTGTLTGIVYGDPITPIYSTTATVASPVGTYPITGQLADPNNRLRNYDATIVPAALTVVKAPLAVIADDKSKQYSDAVPPLTVSFQGFVLGETPAVLGGALVLHTDVAPDTGPGAYPIAVGGLTSPNYEITFVAGKLTVTAEDASVSFIAPTTATASPATGNATVMLAALVTDAADGAPGDIRHATLTFVDRATGKTLCTAPIGLVASSDTTKAVATCTFTASAGTYTIESRVGGWYTRDAAADDVTLTVIQATNDFVTGAGSVTFTGSAGSYASDAGVKSQFLLNPQYDNTGSVRGTVKLTYHRTQNDGVHDYELNASNVTSMFVVPSTAGGTAWIIGAATLTDVTVKNAPVVVDGDALLIASFGDNGQPNTSDTVAYTLLARGGGLLFSSKWDGAHTLDQTIDNGTVQVHIRK